MNKRAENLGVAEVASKETKIIEAVRIEFDESLYIRRGKIEVPQNITDEELKNIVIDDNDKYLRLEEAIGDYDEDIAVEHIACAGQFFVSMAMGDVLDFGFLTSREESEETSDQLIARKNREKAKYFAKLLHEQSSGKFYRLGLTKASLEGAIYSNIRSGGMASAWNPESFDGADYLEDILPLMRANARHSLTSYDEDNEGQTCSVSRGQSRSDATREAMHKSEIDFEKLALICGGYA